jgi:hypothetical protein
VTIQQRKQRCKPQDRKGSYIFDPIEVKEWLEKQAASSSEHSGQNNSTSEWRPEKVGDKLVTNS